MTATRGTSNTNARGSAEDRRRRREWLVETYKADHPLLTVVYTDGTRTQPLSFIVSADELLTYEFIAEVIEHPTCRCYRCGRLLVNQPGPDGFPAWYTVTVDRITPGCKGGRYVRANIRPACCDCNSETGGALAHEPKKRRAA